MKKLYTFIVLTFITLFFLAFNTGTQKETDKSHSNSSYEIIKKNFFDAFNNYNNNLKEGIETPLPVDASGTFEVDKSGHFNVRQSGNKLRFPHRNPILDIVSNYIFSQSTTTYTTIVGGSGTTLIASDCDDDTYGDFPIGFTFNYDGNDYTSFGGSCNGWIALGPGIPSGYYSPLCDGVPSVIAPFAGDLMGGATGNGWYYQTSGTAPNRVLTVEWYHWGFWANNALDEMNFQIKLFESTNIVSFIYQPRTPANTYDMQVGIMDARTSDFSIREGTSSWSSTVAGTDYCASVSYSTSYYPADGLTFTFSPPNVGIIGNSNIIKGFMLYQNYPNPFNPATTIQYSIPKAGNVKLVIYNALGEEVSTPVNENKPAGKYSLTFSADNLASGVYYYSIKSGDFTEVKKMVLIK